MSVNLRRVRKCIQEFDFENLFIDELGWDRHSMQVESTVEGQTHILECVAQKRGMYVLQCRVAKGVEFPAASVRHKIGRQTARSAHEHLIIFVDETNNTQVWQTPEREKGRAVRFHYHEYRRGQSGESLSQKVAEFAVTLDEEESITLPDVLERTRSLFVDRITRQFYDRFKNEHAAFFEFIKGIRDTASREWYASLMLNRLMFVYFIQKKGFLDGNTNYLRDRLEQTKQIKGRNKFHSFYRYFLLRLFHEGLGQRPQDRESALDGLLGRVPYLNGGLFDVHELEEANPSIQISDEAFENLFDFFDQYQWHLDDRPVRDDNEINPDVLGYIFEKYINQKQMGAYYTKEDITEYISRNTIIPYLFDAVRERCTIAFEPKGAVWRLLKDDPTRYILDAVGHGVFINIHTDERLAEPAQLPDEIVAGLEDIAARDDWNRTAPEEFALPTETWREVIARRDRCEELTERLASGDVTDINDLITYNLDICRFAEDVIRTSEGSELLRAFYVVIAGRQPQKSNEKFQPGVSVLDPTCGSGAFLFAALNILEPLYEACLERMQEFLDDQKRLGDRRRYKLFNSTLDQIAEHPSRRYFIFKSIIINNLFGVDIMPEAVEICKLRLFLKLVSQVDRVEQLEPLPDVDFNIRPGNTVVGFESLEDVRKAAEREVSGQGRIVFGEVDDEISQIESDADIVNRMYRMFRRQQTALGGHVTAEDKAELRHSLDRLTDRLNEYLAKDYNVDPTKVKKFNQWKQSHQPFHWLAEFYGIMAQGGFDVVIGNPPWKEYASVRRDYTVKGYSTERCGNLHGICTERALTIRSTKGRASFIVQLPLVSSSRMVTVRDLLRSRSEVLHVIPFDDRPGKLFDGLQHCRSVIWLSSNIPDGEIGSLISTRYQRWYTSVRKHLFSTIEFAAIDQPTLYPSIFPKYASAVEESVFTKVRDNSDTTVGNVLDAGETKYFNFYQ